MASTKTDTKTLTSQGRVESAPVITAAPSANASVVTTERVRKITTKLFQKIKLGVENQVKIAGAIRGYKSRTGQYGEYYAFIGEFRLVTSDGVFISSELILPAFPESILKSAYDSAFDAAGDTALKSIEAMFAVGIWRKDDSANTRNARGFTWEVNEIFKMREPDATNDPYLKLLA